MADLLKGAEVCGALKESLTNRNKELIAKGVTPFLKIVRIGKRPDDLSYEHGIVKRFEGLGIKIAVESFPEDISHEKFNKAFHAINDDNSVHGILLFRPMPKHIDEKAIMEIYKPGKDMDGMCAENAAKVFAGDKTGFAPCTPCAVMELLKHYKIDLKGKNVTVIGRSMVVGKPLSMLLLQEDATITICHTRTVDLPSKCREADILIAAAGSAKMVKAEHVKPDSIVIDVGINYENGKLCGDVDFDEVKPIVSKITPVPGGIGVVTTSILAMHLLEAAERLV